MNLKMIRYILGRVIQLEALLLLAPLAVSLFHHDGNIVYRAYANSFLLTLGCGTLLSLNKPHNTKIFTQDGLAIVALIWTAYSLLGALPLTFSHDIPHYTDAFFQMTSGFTTTGASILQNIETLSYASKFWLSFSHLIGGMGVLVFVLAILPGMSADTVNIMKAEVPGPSFGKINSRIHDTAKRLYLIYFGLTAILVIALRLAGMNLFDALTHAFSTAGTGGFSNYNNSIGHFESSTIHIILAVGMLIFAVNFNIFHYLLLSRGKGRVRSEEFRWYIGIIALSVLAITLSILPQYQEAGQSLSIALRDSFFTTTSIISTTGFSTADFSLWPTTSHVILLFLMFCGGCAGSTGGGLKVSRVAMLTKSGIQGVHSAFEPKRALPLRFEFKTLSQKEMIKLAQYLMVYISIFFLCLIIVSRDGYSFSESFSAVAANINNVGPGLGHYGPSGNFGSLSDLSKITLSFAMIAGRLEIYPLLILLKIPGKILSARDTELNKRSR